MADKPLRRKPVLKPADSRYVSLFSDANNKSDITFTDGHKGLLPKSTKLYEVGVDNLSISLNGVSMMSTKKEPIVLEILGLNTWLTQGPNVQDWLAFPADFRILEDDAARGFQLRDDDVFLNYSQFMERLSDIASLVTDFINEGFDTRTLLNGVVTGSHFQFRNVLPFAEAHIKNHLSFDLDNAGRILISGSKTFWSYFFIHIPNAHYRAIFYGREYDATMYDLPAVNAQAVVSIAPNTGNVLVDRLTFDDFGGIRKAFVAVWNDFDGNDPANLMDNVFQAKVSNNPDPNNNAEAALTAAEIRKFAYTIRSMRFSCNLYSSLDERVCIEVGTSLPITHSALIEDNREKPDYSIGRFMIKPDLRIGYNYGNQTHDMLGPGTFELMNSEKRVMYHRLLPQEKVSVLRIQMYIRRRSFDAARNKWTMVSSPLPTINSDWWHCRLHFRELHETALSQKESPSQ